MSTIIMVFSTQSPFMQGVVVGSMTGNCRFYDVSGTCLLVITRPVLLKLLMSGDLNYFFCFFFLVSMWVTAACCLEFWAVFLPLNILCLIFGNLIVFVN